jgi:hypothetical protein
MEPTYAAVFVYLLVRKKPALEKGRRKINLRTVPAVTFVQHPFSAYNV